MAKVKIAEKAKQILVNVEKFIDAKTESVAENTKYIAIIALVPAIVSALAALAGIPYLKGIGAPFAGLTQAIGVWLAISVFIITILAALLALLIGGGLIHIFARVFGAKRKYPDTVAAMAASMTPSLLLGWIPLVNIWAGVYSVAILVFGLSRKQRLTLARSALAIVILPIIIAGVLLAGLSIAGLEVIKALIPTFVWG